MPAKDPRAARAIETNTALEKLRGGIEDDITDLNRLVVPHLDIQTTRAGTGFPGSGVSRYRDDLHDSTAVEVHRTLCNGMLAHLTPIGAQWLALQPSDTARATASERDWCHYAGQTLLRLLSPSASNFYTGLYRSFVQDAGFGTGCIIPRLSKARRFVFDSLPILTYSLGEDEDGNPSTLSRVYTLTAAQVLGMFADDTPAEIAKKASDPKQKLDPQRILHLIEPNPQADPKSRRPEDLPFSSIFVCLESETTIRLEGFHEQPHAVSIWEEGVSGPYGNGPFTGVLGEIRQLQLSEENTDILVERAGNPPWFIPPGYDGHFDPRPHAINSPTGTATGDDVMPRELETRGRLDYLESRSNHKRQVIKDAGFYDLFRLLSTHADQTKTAYEVRELMGEKATLFHPFYARKTAQLTQLIRRCLALALRSGLIDPPPPTMVTMGSDGKPYLPDPEVHYNSKLARALELNESNALLATVDALLPLAGQDGIASPVFDWLNPSMAGPTLARTYGVSHHLMASPEQIAAKQQARAQAAQQAQLGALAQTASETVRNLGGIDGASKAANLLQPQTIDV